MKRILIGLAAVSLSAMPVVLSAQDTMQLFLASSRALLTSTPHVWVYGITRVASSDEVALLPLNRAREFLVRIPFAELLEPSASLVPDSVALEWPHPATYTADDKTAVLHLYRRNKIVGSANDLGVQMGDKTVFWAENNSKTNIRVTKPGLDSLYLAYTWWKSGQVSLSLDIELGHEYYICVDQGQGGTPKIILMDAETGKKEFDKIKWSKYYALINKRKVVIKP